MAISLHQAVERRIRRVRMAHWACPQDYVLIDIVRGWGDHHYCGPWGHLYSPLQRVCHQTTPQHILIATWDFDAAEWDEYTGELWAEETT